MEITKQIYSELNEPPFLLEQFRETEVQKLAMVPDRQFQELEDAAHSLLSGMWIDGGEGIQLDILGLHIDLARYGKNDTTYKTLLKLKACANTTGGTAPTLIDIVRELYDATEIHYTEIYPAKIQILQNGALGVTTITDLELSSGDLLVDHTGEVIGVEEPDELPESILLDLLPAGVGMIVGYEFFVEDAGALTSEVFCIESSPMYVLTEV